VSRRGDATDLPAIDMLMFGVTLGWGSRRTAPAEPDRSEQADRLEEDVPIEVGGERLPR